MGAWIDLTQQEEDEAWRRVDRCLRFRPSVSADKWPGILEPKPFKTFALSHFWGATNKEFLEADLESKAARILQACAAVDSRLYALDWQHDCYWLTPHQLSPGEPWVIPAFPNGDYYMFLSQNFDFGWFGHPWEESICVFGTQLLRALDASTPELFTNVLRASV